MKATGRKEKGKENNERGYGRDGPPSSPAYQPRDPTRRAGHDLAPIQEGLQIRGKLSGRLVAMGGLLFKALSDDHLEVGGNVSIPPAKRGRIFGEDLAEGITHRGLDEVFGFVNPAQLGPKVAVVTREPRIVVPLDELLPCVAIAFFCADDQHRGRPCIPIIRKRGWLLVHGR
jgi:hypothetical protein